MKYFGQFDYVNMTEWLANLASYHHLGRPCMRIFWPERSTALYGSTGCCMLSIALARTNTVDLWLAACPRDCPYTQASTAAKYSIRSRWALHAWMRLPRRLQREAIHGTRTPGYPSQHCWLLGSIFFTLMSYGNYSIATDQILEGNNRQKPRAEKSPPYKEQMTYIHILT